MTAAVQDSLRLDVLMKLSHNSKLTYALTEAVTESQKLDKIINACTLYCASIRLFTIKLIFQGLLGPVLVCHTASN